VVLWDRSSYKIDYSLFHFWGSIHHHHTYQIVTVAALLKANGMNFLRTTDSLHAVQTFFDHFRFHHLLILDEEGKSIGVVSELFSVKPLL